MDTQSIKTRTMTRLFGAGLLLSIAGQALAGPGIGDLAPDFTATTLSGETVQLSDFRGSKPVYLKFWATWCTYCKVEMPHMKAVLDEQGEALEVLTINVGLNDSVERIEQLFADQGFQLPTVFDADGAITSQFGVVGTPHHVLINREGQIIYRTFLASDTLDDKIQQLAQPGVSKTTAQTHASSEQEISL